MSKLAKRVVMMSVGATAALVLSGCAGAGTATPTESASTKQSVGETGSYVG